jgi:hypothetical protein
LLEAGFLTAVISTSSYFFWFDFLDLLLELPEDEERDLVEAILLFFAGTGAGFPTSSNLSSSSEILRLI